MRREKAANFDALAHLYAPLEQCTFGRALTRRRACFLGDWRIASARRVLVLGDGDGRFTAALLERYPTIEVDAVDASAAMLCELQRRVMLRAPHAALAVHHVDLRTWTPAKHGFDLVVAHFFFDCLTTGDIAAMVARLAPALAPNARWLVSEFTIPSNGARALAARVLVRALYFAFQIITGLEVKRLPNYEGALVSAGFTCARAEAALGGALRSELWQRWSRALPAPARPTRSSAPYPLQRALPAPARPTRSSVPYPLQRALPAPACPTRSRTHTPSEPPSRRSPRTGVSKRLTLRH